MTVLLDPDIRDWVVLPLFVIMVITGLLRQSVGMLFSNAKVKIPYVCQRGQYMLKQTTRLVRTSAGHYMTTHQYNVRKEHTIQLLQQQLEWCENEKVKQQEEAENDDGSSSNNNAASDPMADMMANPMKMMGGNMFFMVQNMVMMQGIQHFFSGFILLKIPFPLTVGFKNMFQKGVMDMPDLEPSYVSSVSWYFLVMYGLRSFLRLMIGNPYIEQKEQDMLQEKLGLQNPPPPGKTQDIDSTIKLLKNEIENLELFVAQHKSEMDNVEKRLLGIKRYPKKKVNIMDDMMNAQEATNFLLGSKSSKKKQ